MKLNNSIINIVDYGTVILDLRTQMKKNEFNKDDLHKTTGLDYKTINNYVDGNIIRVNNKILSKFCYVLNCNINDVLIYSLESK